MAQLPRRSEQDEVVASDLGEIGDRRTGQPVVGGYGELEALHEQVVPPHRRIARPSPGDLQVDGSLGDQARPQGVAGLLKAELHVGMLRVERAHHVGDEPVAERQLERERDGAPFGVEELLDGGDAVVEVVHRRVDVALEELTRLGRAQHAADPLEQGGADLVLQAGEGPGHPGLAHHREVGHLGDRRPVADLLEPVQRLGLHDP